MSQVILTAAGTALGGPIGGAIGKVAGGLIDKAALQALNDPRQIGPHLAGLQLHSTAEGAPMACVYGRMRVAAQMIWAAHFKERRIEQASGGGKGGPTTVSYAYSLSFASALCEGPIDGIGRIWADGQPMDLTGVTMRVHTGGPDQTPDPLIEAIEGSAPAYRGVAYLVFEDLPLALYGNRPPSLMVEVFRRPEGLTPGLEDRLGAVCMIPGAGEFVYATSTVLRRDGLTRSTAENVNNSSGSPDIMAALDQLQARAPNVRAVNLVLAWFGDDLRVGHCRIRPGVEEAEKATIPYAWSAGGAGRADAHVISTHDGGPAYGGTPCDRTVIEAITELKARGYAVTLYPMVLMDIPPGNGLPDPHGGAQQPAYPWRGRITGSAGMDKTSAAADEVAAFFGAAAPGDFSASGGVVGYSGPDEWSYRRFVLACAHLAEAAGGVDGFLLGSELVGLTTLRSDGSTYPAVAALRTLAADCASVLRTGTEIGYAADWTEYYGHQPRDGSGDVFFHLDPLWADSHIGFVGVDWYAPLADWRDGADHRDAAAGWQGPYDPAYLAANVAGGEGYDWYYADDAARLAQTRTAITDGGYGEPWVFRPKDLVNWWSNVHHNRPGGVRSAVSTPWTPGMKPIRFVEFGCPAVDKGSNAPNLFVDPKSAESTLPPFSSGARDDLAQRRALETLLDHYAGPDNVPVIGGVAMMDQAAMAAWCWDARPFPDFPARAKVWADAPNWLTGHWLNGRIGAMPVAELLAAILTRGGVPLEAIDLSGAEGLVEGYLLNRPMTLAAAIEPLAAAYAFDLAERGGRIAAVGREAPVVMTLAANDLAVPPRGFSEIAPTRAMTPLPDGIAVRFVDANGDYRTGAVTVLADPAGGGAGVVPLDLPILLGADDAARIAARRLRRVSSERDTAVVHVGPAAALTAEPGDMIVVEADAEPWRVARVNADAAPYLTLARVEAPDVGEGAIPAFATADPSRPLGPPALILLDLPPLEGAEDDARPLAAIAADPWRAFDLYAGPSADALTLRSTAADPATVGETLSALAPGPLYRFDDGARLTVRIEGGVLSSASEAAVLNGANPLAILADNGEWELIQYCNADLVAPGTYILSGLLRGQAGTDAAMRAGAATGALVVILNRDLIRASVSQSERGLPLVWRAAPSGGPPGGLAMTEATFTWEAVTLRPFAPCHLKALALGDGTLRFSWIRRARIGGDPWLAGEVPLGETSERYRLDILSGTDVVRSLTVSAPTVDYAAADQATDFPSGLPSPLTVEVRQGSDAYGWGAPLRRGV
jgi:hypothetical protein